MTFPGRRGALLLLLLAMAIVLPPYLGTYYTRFATQIAIYGMAALSVDLLLGYTGLITFGQAALFGVGAYAAGMLTVYGVTNAFVAWPLAILVSMLFAAKGRPFSEQHRLPQQPTDLGLHRPSLPRSQFRQRRN